MTFVEVSGNFLIFNTVVAMVPGDTCVGYESAPEFDPKRQGNVTGEISGGWKMMSYLRRN